MPLKLVYLFYFTILLFPLLISVGILRHLAVEQEVNRVETF